MFSDILIVSSSSASCLVVFVGCCDAVGDVEGLCFGFRAVGAWAAGGDLGCQCAGAGRGRGGGRDMGVVAPGW